MFGFWGQKLKWKVRDYHTDKFPLEHFFPLLQRWAGCTTQTNAYILILASFSLFLTCYCMPHHSTNHVAAAWAICLEYDCSLGLEPTVSLLLTHP